MRLQVPARARGQSRRSHVSRTARRSPPLPDWAQGRTRMQRRPAPLGAWPRRGGGGAQAARRTSVAGEARVAQGQELGAAQARTCDECACQLSSRVDLYLRARRPRPENARAPPPSLLQPRPSRANHARPSRSIVHLDQPQPQGGRLCRLHVRNCRTKNGCPTRSDPLSCLVRCALQSWRADPTSAMGVSFTRSGGV